MSATCGGLRVWSLYVPNGRTLDSDHYAYKLQWLAALRVALLAEQPTVPPLFLCGDFNIAPTDNDVWDPAAFIGSTHVSAPEREALAALISGLVPSKAAHSRTGITAQATSIRDWACASTWCCWTTR
jgi:exonuclease III